jgi:hypothetical protein
VGSPELQCDGCVTEVRKKIKDGKNKNEHTNEIMGVKGMSEERIPKLIMEWIPEERRKRGHLRKTWMEGVQAAMTARNLEPDQWRNREEWRLVYGRRRQLLQNWMD